MKLRSLITLGLTLTAIAVPTAIAGPLDSYIGNQGGRGAAVPVLAASNGTFRAVAGGPGAAGPVLAASNRTFRAVAGGPGAAGPVLAEPNPSNSYLGHEGGPGAAGPILTERSVAGNGFDFADAAVGGAFVAGIALLAGAALMARRRRELAQLH